MYLVFKRFGSDWYQESPVEEKENIHLRVGKSKFLNSILNNGGSQTIYLALQSDKADGICLHLSPGTTDLWKLEKENEWVTITMPAELKGIQEIYVSSIDLKKFKETWVSEYLGKEVTYNGKLWKVCGSGKKDNEVILGSKSGEIASFIVPPTIECESYSAVSLRDVIWEGK